MPVLPLCTPKSKETPMPHTQVAVGIHFSEQENPPFFFQSFSPNSATTGDYCRCFFLKATIPP